MFERRQGHLCQRKTRLCCDSLKLCVRCVAYFIRARSGVAVVQHSSRGPVLQHSVLEMEIVLLFFVQVDKLCRPFALQMTAAPSH
jgi:hypothetical protein